MSTEAFVSPSGPPEPGAGAAMDRLGPYRLVQRLGQGGMGVVHLALDPHGRAVAIKVLRAHIAADPEARARLEREVQALGRIRHPRVAPVIDADLHGVRPYVVTRFVDGEPLDDAISTHGPLRGDALLQVARGLFGALEAIHGVGVVHRDLKPGNVLLDDGGHPVVIDFGIAHVADDSRLTATGLVMGTPGYLSPEIVEGAEVTEATDWWGWAATLAYAATGRPPFGRGAMDVVLARVRAGEFDLDGVDPRLEPLLAAALSPRPDERPPSPLVLAALERYAAGEYATAVLPVGGTPTAGLPNGGLPNGGPWAGGPATSAPRAPGAGGHPEASGRHTGWTQELPASSPAPAPTPTMAPPAAPSPQPGWSAAAHPAPPQSPPPGWAALAQPAPAPMPHQVLAPVPTPQTPNWAPVESTPRTATEWGQAERDPRIGRPDRIGPLAAGAAALAALAMVAPAAAVLLWMIWSGSARVLDRSVTALLLRRFRNGRRTSDLAWATVMAPLHALGGVLGAAVAGLLPFLVGVAGLACVGLVAESVSGPSARLISSLGLAAAMLLWLAMSWWGPGGASLRRGAKSLARGLAPVGLIGDIVVGVLSAAAIGLTVWALVRRGVPIWWPLQSVPTWIDNLVHLPR